MSNAGAPLASYTRVMGLRLAAPIPAMAVLVLAGLALRAQTTSPCANTPAYATCELVFELSEQAAAAHPQPYRTVEMKAEFRSPRRRTLAMPAYWDGGRRMVVRFSPTEPGDWDTA